MVGSSGVIHSEATFRQSLTRSHPSGVFLYEAMRQLVLQEKILAAADWIAMLTSSENRYSCIQPGCIRTRNWMSSFVHFSFFLRCSSFFHPSLLPDPHSPLRSMSRPATGKSKFLAVGQARSGKPISCQRRGIPWRNDSLTKVCSNT